MCKSWPRGKRERKKRKINCKKGFNIAEDKETLSNLTLLLLWCNEMRAHVQKLNNTGIMFATMQNKRWSSEKKEKN